MTTRYHVSLPDPARVREAGPHAFSSHGAEGLARELEAALRGDTLFESWRSAQDDPDMVDPALGATDPQATVSGIQRETRVDLVASTALPGNVFRHRMRLLAGHAWELRDVRD
jgi:hypothetical protein